MTIIASISTADFVSRCFALFLLRRLISFETHKTFSTKQKIVEDIIALSRRYNMKCSRWAHFGFPLCSSIPLVCDHQTISTISSSSSSFCSFFSTSTSSSSLSFSSSSLSSLSSSSSSSSSLSFSSPFSSSRKRSHGGKVIVDDYAPFSRSLLLALSLPPSHFFLISHSVKPSMFVSFANPKKSYRARKPDE